MPHIQKIKLKKRVKNKQNQVVYEVKSFDEKSGLYTCKNQYFGEICVYYDDLIRL